MRIAITGGSGFLGSHLSHAFYQAGHDLVLLMRTTSSAERLQGISFEKRIGDLNDRDSLVEVFKDCDVIVHNAAEVNDWGDFDRFFQTNVVGTENVLSAANTCNIKHIIYTSSLAVLGNPQETSIIDENAPYYEYSKHPYIQTKISAEKIAIDYADRDQDLSLTIIRPGAIWGEGDPIFFPRWNKLASKGLFTLPGKRQNSIGLSNVHNLKAAYLLALEQQGKATFIYHIVDQEYTNADQFFFALAKRFNYPYTRLYLPKQITNFAAMSIEVIAWALNQRGIDYNPPISRYGLHLLTSDCRYPLTRARHELNYRPPISIEEGIERLYQWAKEK